jgi:hypothetical protein
MKFKTTNKELKNRVPSNYLFKTGYCDLQHLLHYTRPIAYASGVYGWNYDVYCIDDVYITTGYRSMVGNQIPFELVREYDEKAREIVNSWGKYEYDEKKQLINDLLKEFIEKIQA